MRIYYMKTTAFLTLMKSLLILGLVCNFAFTASAQDYYPAVIGNEWVLERTDGLQRQTYTLEKPEDAADEEYTLLKIETQTTKTEKILDTDKYFLTTDEEGIKLHKTILQQEVGVTKTTATAELPTPVIFFPKVLELGDTWDIVADAELEFLGTKLPVKSTTNFEIEGFEDVITPAGKFQNCAKIKLVFLFDIVGLAININPTTSYQWLAPNVGPVKYQTSEGRVFEIKSFKLYSPPPIEAQNLPMWDLQPEQTFTVTGFRLGGILTAKILENVEDYVTEVHDLGITNMTGEIVEVGDGTGFATNLQGKQDLWVAGRFTDAPIRGRITLFAVNNIGRSQITLNIIIN